MERINEKTKDFAIKSAKELSAMVAMVVILIVAQFLLSFVAGVELVTVLLLCFSYTFGVKRGMLVATSYSLLRCFIWGFFPTVIILYLVYFNCFSAIFGYVGYLHYKKNAKNISTDTQPKKYDETLQIIIVVWLATLCTISFTLLDNIITPLFYKYTYEAAIAYAYSSLTAVIPQTVCTIVSVSILFRPVSQALQRVKTKAVMH